MSKSCVEKVLLIDDSEIDLFIQKRFLEVANFSTQLVTHRSADEALKYLQDTNANTAPEVIFLDLNMPAPDGFSFLVNFPKLPPAVTGKSKIVVLSSSENANDRDYVFSFSPVIHFIVKPLKQSDIEDLKKVF